MSSLHIRRYAPGDADAIWDLHVRALADVGAYDDEFAHLDADLHSIEEAYLDVGGEFLVGEFRGAGEIVAMGAFQPCDVAVTADSVLDRSTVTTPDDAVVIRRMRVDPDHQRRGFATAILAELERRAGARGFDRAFLDTTTRQRAAIAFYEHHGYELLHRETIEGHELLFYGKALGEPAVGRALGHRSESDRI